MITPVFILSYLSSTRFNIKNSLILILLLALPFLNNINHLILFLTLILSLQTISLIKNNFLTKAIFNISIAFLFNILLGFNSIEDKISIILILLVFKFILTTNEKTPLKIFISDIWLSSCFAFYALDKNIWVSSYLITILLIIYLIKHLKNNLSILGFMSIFILLSKTELEIIIFSLSSLIFILVYLNHKKEIFYLGILFLAFFLDNSIIFEKINTLMCFKYLSYLLITLLIITFVKIVINIKNSRIFLNYKAILILLTAVSIGFIHKLIIKTDSTYPYPIYSSFLIVIFLEVFYIKIVERVFSYIELKISKFINLFFLFLKLIKLIKLKHVLDNFLRIFKIIYKNINKYYKNIRSIKIKKINIYSNIQKFYKILNIEILIFIITLLVLIIFIGGKNA